MEYKIKCQEPYVSLISKGKKTIEGRLDKGLFQELKIGDKVIWYNQNHSVNTIIIKKYKYNTFMDMIIAHGIKNVLPNVNINNGKDTLYNGIGVYRNFYKKIKEKKYSVLAIKINVIE